MTAEPITLQMALDDPAPLFAVTCRACGVRFEDVNGHRLCDPCLAERINGAGELELDDPDDVINQTQPKICGDCGQPFMTSVPERGQCAACIAKRLGIRQTNITCRVHLLLCPANDRGVLLCPDCLGDLAAAAAHIAELRETTLDAWLTWLGTQDDAVIDWWRKMEALESKTFKGKCMLAIAKGGRGAAVVQAWQAKEDTLKRCEAAEREIEGARDR